MALQSELADLCTCHVVENPWTYYGIVEPGGALEPDPECPVHSPGRWRVACINWTAPDASHATTYCAIDDGLAMSQHWGTWADAIAWLDEHADDLEAWAIKLTQIARERERRDR